MDAIVKALEEQHAELDALLIGLDDTGWSRPSPCDGWDVADVLLHLAQTDELALASARGEFAAGVDRLAGRIDPTITRNATDGPPANGGAAANVDAGADVMVITERGRPSAELYERWRTGATELVAVLGAADPHQRVTWVAGELSTRTLATTRLAETWIHTGDVAAALGVQLAPTDRLRHIARLAWRTVPYAFARAGRERSGPVRFTLQGPNGDSWDFMPDEEPLTLVEGDALELCLVAARRVDPAATGLRASGPDAEGVLELVRTYA